MSDATLRVGILGCGRAAEAHASAMRATDEVDLVAAVDPAESARLRAADAWECPVFPSLEEMLRRSQIDAASVCVPPPFHGELTRRLLEEGIHVLCERPGTRSSGALRDLLQEARQRELVLMVSSKFAFVEDVRRAVELVENGVVGRPVGYRVRLCTTVPGNGDWHEQPHVSGSGVVFDNGSDAYDLLHQIGALPVARMTALLQNSWGHRGDADHTAEVICELGGGAMSEVTLSWSYPADSPHYLVVHGTDGTVRVGWEGGSWRRHGGTEWHGFGSGYDGTDAFRRQFVAFREWVRTGRPVERLADPALRLAFIESVYRASKSSTWCPLQCDEKAAEQSSVRSLARENGRPATPPRVTTPGQGRDAEIAS